MDIRLKTHTEYDLPHLQEMQWLIDTAIAPKQARQKRLVLLLWGVFFLLVGLVLTLKFKDGPLSIASVFCACWGAFLLLRGIFYYQITAFFTYRSMGGDDVKTDFHFDKSGIQAVRGKQSSRFTYDQCTSLYETKNSLFFIMGNGEGIMLDKRNVKGGSADDLRALLEEKSGISAVWVGKKA